MTDYLTAPPRAAVIPVTRGCDRAFTVQRVDDTGAAQPYAPGTTVYLWIDIDKTAPTKVDAAVSGAHATFAIPSTVCDQVKNGTRWRAVLDLGDNEIPLLVGRFERHDG